MFPRYANFSDRAFFARHRDFAFTSCRDSDCVCVGKVEIFIPYDYTFFRLTRHLSLPSNTIIGKPFNRLLPPRGILSFVRCSAHIVAGYKPCSFNAPPRIIYLLLRIKKLKPLALFRVFFRFKSKKVRKKATGLLQERLPS